MTDKARTRLAWVTFGFSALVFVAGFAYGALSALRLDLFVASMFSFPGVGVSITS